MAIQPNEELYKKKNIAAMNGIVKVRPKVDLKLIVANYGSG